MATPDIAPDRSPAPTRQATFGGSDACDADGVDLAQIVDMLRLSPEERLDALRGFTAGLVELMNAAQRA